MAGMTANINEVLPHEIIALILGWLDDHEQAYMRPVCKLWNGTCDGKTCHDECLARVANAERYATATEHHRRRKEIKLRHERTAIDAVFAEPHVISDSEMRMVNICYRRLKFTRRLCVANEYTGQNMQDSEIDKQF